MATFQPGPQGQGAQRAVLSAQLAAVGRWPPDPRPGVPVLGPCAFPSDRSCPSSAGVSARVRGAEGGGASAAAAPSPPPLRARAAPSAGSPRTPVSRLSWSPLAAGDICRDHATREPREPATLRARSFPYICFSDWC